MSPKTLSRLLLLPALVALILVASPAAPSRAAIPDAPAAKTGYSGQFSYLFVAGSGLHPRARTTTWSYPGMGCVSAAGGNDLFTMHVDLPEGSRIDYLRLYAYDASAANSRAWLTRFDGTGGWTDLTAIDSSGTGGYGSQLSPFTGHVVHNAGSAYVVQWQANQTGSTMRLCGLRIAYRLPVTYTYMSAVLR